MGTNAKQILWETLAPSRITSSERKLINRVVDYGDNPAVWTRPTTAELTKSEQRAYKSLIAKHILESGRPTLTFTPGIYNVFFMRDQPIERLS